MNALADFAHRYGTRALGVAAGTITTLCGAGVIPDRQMKYWLAALAVLTYWRGASSASAYNALASVQLSPKLTEKP